MSSKLGELDPQDGLATIRALEATVPAGQKVKWACNRPPKAGEPVRVLRMLSGTLLVMPDPDAQILAALTVAKELAETPVEQPPKAGDDPAHKGLTPKEQAVFDVLPGEDSPMLGRDVCARLTRQRVTIDEAELSRICNRPHMQARGVRNRPGAGYYKLNTI